MAWRARAKGRNSNILTQYKFAGLAARAAFVSMFLLQKQLNNKLPRLAPFAGDMKFATQISPLKYSVTLIIQNIP